MLFKVLKSICDQSLVAFASIKMSDDFRLRFWRVLSDRRANSNDLWYRLFVWFDLAPNTIAFSQMSSLMSWSNYSIDELQYMLEKVTKRAKHDESMQPIQAALLRMMIGACLDERRASEYYRWKFHPETKRPLDQSIYNDPEHGRMTLLQSYTKLGNWANKAVLSALWLNRSVLTEAEQHWREINHGSRAVVMT